MGAMFFEKKTFIKCVLFCTVLAVSSHSAKSYSESKPLQTEHVAVDRATLVDKEVIVDGIKYSKFDLIRDFLNVAFSNTLWQENTGEHFSKYFEYYVRRLAEKPTEKDSKMLASDFPHPEWVRAQYAALKGDYPKFGVINKWNKTTIDVAVDWPRSGLSRSEEEQRLIDVVAAQVQHLAPQIKQATKIDLNFLWPNDPKENSKDYARIRVVFSSAHGNFFKMLHGIGFTPFTLGHGGKDKTSETNIYWGAVAFTPYARSSVDGYFLPDTQNNIDLAVCKISPVLPADIVKALVTECLIRAMGLTDTSKERDDSLVGNWNKEYDAYSKIAAFDKDIADAIDHRDKIEVSTASDFKVIEKDFKAYWNLTEYDLQLLKLLYCAKIKPRMDKYQVIKTLATSNECF